MVPAMNVQVRCSRTDKPLQISVPDDDKSIAEKWDKHIRFSCPHCSSEHTIKFRAAWVTGILDDLCPIVPPTNYLHKSLKSQRA